MAKPPLRRESPDDIGVVQHTFLGFWLNGALGSGKYDDVTLEVVQAHLRGGTIFFFLEERLGADIDLSIYSTEQRAKISAEWRDIEEGNSLDKFAVKRNGLCLLVAIILEAVQLRVS